MKLIMSLKKKKSQIESRIRKWTPPMGAAAKSESEEDRMTATDTRRVRCVVTVREMKTRGVTVC